MEHKRIYSTDEMKSILSDLATEYDKTSGEPLTVLIVGGSAAIFQFDFKKDTKDIDIVLTKASPIFDECKQIISNRFGFFLMNCLLKYGKRIRRILKKLFLRKLFRSI